MGPLVALATFGLALARAIPWTAALLIGFPYMVWIWRALWVCARNSQGKWVLPVRAFVALSVALSLLSLQRFVVRDALDAPPNNSLERSRER